MRLGTTCWKLMMGAGGLVVNEPKTDSYGNSPVVYVSRRCMVALSRFREARDRMGRTKPGDRRIFQLGAEPLGDRVKAAFTASGLGSDLSTRSMRIGMAQELALAGFGMVLIMQAGRWSSVAMPRYYIRGLNVDEQAVPRWHRMVAEGKREVDLGLRGYDVLSTYEFVRLGN